ncbi:hypothetical protein MNBD_CHLOROFLEXI01-5384 [hydrothermal vent metagenome]|uniref:Peptidase A2 domain-containing protein n=1 Tax=hydrothermal vent metagenome TaxID=652676 RepID=A0A3B0VLZ6_9ZZZZ
MQLSFEYNRVYLPAFPVLDLTISATMGGRQQTTQGLIDFGSDITQIPLPILRTIEARDVDDRWVRDASGLRVPVAIYVVQLQIGSSVLPSIEVVGRTGSNETIVGRDVLNQYIVTLNGLANVTKIQD